MVNYANGKIYKITNDLDNRKYYGSTTMSLSKRLNYHKNSAKNGTMFKLYQHMRLLGIDHFKIQLIKEYPCETRKQLLDEEGKYIQKIFDTERSLNSEVAGRSKSDSQLYYNTIHKTDISKNKKKYYKNNRKQILEQRKLYWKNNKDILSQKQKRKFTCICGSTIRWSDKVRHFKSKKHIDFLNN